jgi:hypothetical protein
MEEPIVPSITKNLWKAVCFSLIIGASATREATAQIVSPVYVYQIGPAGSYLIGAASVIRAQGQFLVDNQKALMMREEVLQKRLETKRKAQEQWLWERDNLPTYSDNQRRYEAELHILSHHASPTEIWSGKALNRLLDDLMNNVPSQNAASPSGTRSLTPEMLAKISVSNKNDGGPNIAVFKGGKMTWPLPFFRPEFAEARRNLDQLVATAHEQAKQGQLKPELCSQFEPAVDDLTDQVRAKAKVWRVRDYIDAKFFLSQLDDAVRVMRLPDAADYLVNKYHLQGQTVADLVRYMKEQGLFFGPAAKGSEAAYTALYYALRDYDKEVGTPVRKAR